MTLHFYGRGNECIWSGGMTMHFGRSRGGGSYLVVPFVGQQTTVKANNDWEAMHVAYRRVGDRNLRRVWKVKNV